MDATVIPVRSYGDYQSKTLERIHMIDQWLPLFAFFYVFIVFIAYGYQYCNKFDKFDPNIIPIHHIALLCLLMTLIYCVLLFIGAHDIVSEIPLLDSCLTTQRIHLMSLVIVKCFTTWIFIFNLSYMNQSPFFNPRYKYITKKRRKFLHYLFLSFKWVIGIFLPLSVFSAFQRTSYHSFNAPPNNFRYCYMTFNLLNFFVMFATDILGVVLYGSLFGRNACQLTRRNIKKHRKQADVNPNLFATTSQYDIDDPIQKSLVLNLDPSAAAFIYDSASNLTSPCQMNQSLSVDGEFNRSHFLNRSGTISRETAVIFGAENDVKLQEEKGVRELTRVLRLIWFMFVFYWINVLLYVFLGLYTSTASIALVVNGTCILLLNDYEFSGTYWSVRTDITKICCCCCVKQMCGERKYSVNLQDGYGYYNHDDDTAHSKKTILQNTKKSIKKQRGQRAYYT